MSNNTSQNSQQHSDYHDLEKMMQKYEAEIRGYIRQEQELRIFIEQLQDKYNYSEKVNGQLVKQIQQKDEELELIQKNSQKQIEKHLADYEFKAEKLNQQFKQEKEQQQIKINMLEGIIKIFNIKKASPISSPENQKRSETPQKVFQKKRIQKNSKQKNSMTDLHSKKLLDDDEYNNLKIKFSKKIHQNKIPQNKEESAKKQYGDKKNKIPSQDQAIQQIIQQLNIQRIKNLKLDAKKQFQNDNKAFSKQMIKDLIQNYNQQKTNKQK